MEKNDWKLTCLNYLLNSHDVICCNTRVVCIAYASCSFDDWSVTNRSGCGRKRSFLILIRYPDISWKDWGKPPKRRWAYLVLRQMIVQELQREWFPLLCDLYCRHVKYRTWCPYLLPFTWRKNCAVVHDGIISPSHENN